MKKFFLLMALFMSMFTLAQQSIPMARVSGLNSALNNKENWLDLPSTNGYVLSSTTSGIRSWVPINSAVWGNITGTLSNQSDLTTALDAKGGLGSYDIDYAANIGSAVGLVYYHITNGLNGDYYFLLQGTFYGGNSYGHGYYQKLTTVNRADGNISYVRYRNTSLASWSAWTLETNLAKNDANGNELYTYYLNLDNFNSYAEPSLGNPSTNGYVLSSTTSGTRSWVPMAGSSMVYPSSGIPISTGSAWGTSITNNSTNWNTAYSSRISSLTTTGNSGAATLSSNVLNIPNYTLAGLGGISQADGDLRYNLKSDNLDAYNYFYTKGYVDSSFIKCDPAYVQETQQHWINGNLQLTNGGDFTLNGGGSISTAGNIISWDNAGYISTYRRYRASSGSMQFTINGGADTIFNCTKIGNIGTTPLTYATFQSAGKLYKNLLFTSSVGGSLDNVKMNTGCFQISAEWPSLSSLPPQGVFDITDGNNTKHIMTVYSSGIINVQASNIRVPLINSVTGTFTVSTSYYTWDLNILNNWYAFQSTSDKTINMGTIPASMVGQELTMVVTTNGTTSINITAGTNLKMQGTLATGTVSGKKFVLKFFVESTTSVLEVSRTTAM